MKPERKKWIVAAPHWRDGLFLQEGDIVTMTVQGALFDVLAGRLSAPEQAPPVTVSEPAAVEADEAPVLEVEEAPVQEDPRPRRRRGMVANDDAGTD